MRVEADEAPERRTRIEIGGVATDGLAVRVGPQEELLRLGGLHAGDLNPIRSRRHRDGGVYDVQQRDEHGVMQPRGRDLVQHDAQRKVDAAGVGRVVRGLQVGLQHGVGLHELSHAAIDALVRARRAVRLHRRRDGRADAAPQRVEVLRNRRDRVAGARLGQLGARARGVHAVARSLRGGAKEGPRRVLDHAQARQRRGCDDPLQPAAARPQRGAALRRQRRPQQLHEQRKQRDVEPAHPAADERVRPLCRRVADGAAEAQAQLREVGAQRLGV